MNHSSVQRFLGEPPPPYDPYAHYAYVKSLYDAYPLKDQEACYQHMFSLTKKIALSAKSKPLDLLTAIGDAISEILEAEGIHCPVLIAPSSDRSYNEYVLRPGLDRLAAFFENQHSVLFFAENALVSLFSDFLGNLASIKKEATNFQVPAVYLLSDPHEILSGTMSYFRNAPETPSALHGISDKVFRNLLAASGITADKAAEQPAKLRFAVHMSDDHSLSELVHMYFRGTPLERVFMTPVPFEIPQRIRFEHTHILGGSGHGKSTLLCSQFLEDVHSEHSPSLVIVDGKGTFVQALQRFAIFHPDVPLSKRLVVVNPQDIESPPALNMFSVPKRFRGYDDQLRRQIENNTISLFSYIFGSKDFKLTEKQATCLSYCVRLLFSMSPAATIYTLLDLLSDPVVPKTGGIPDTSIFKSVIERHPPVVRRFFSDLFYHPTEYGETKRQIQNRIFSLLENPAFAAMFGAAENKLDLFDIIQNRKILLVNASPGVLGEGAAPVLGRYIVATTLASAYERLAIPKTEWTPAFLVLDEAQMFVDEEKTQPLLQQAREFNLGVVLAHQKLDDLTQKLQATFAANTSIRFAGGISASDASFMAKNMRCEPDFIMDQKKRSATTSFACYVRGYTDRPVSLSIPLGIIDNEPRMSDADYERLMARNRTALSPSGPEMPYEQSIVQESSQDQNVVPEAHEDEDGMSRGTW